MWFCLTDSHILDVEMDKEQEPELGWRVSVLPTLAFYHCELDSLISRMTGMTDRYCAEVYIDGEHER